jgi:hypothetical protein
MEQISLGLHDNMSLQLSLIEEEMVNLSAVDQKLSGIHELAGRSAVDGKSVTALPLSDQKPKTRKLPKATYMITPNPHKKINLNELDSIGVPLTSNVASGLSDKYRQEVRKAGQPSAGNIPSSLSSAALSGISTSTTSLNTVQSSVNLPRAGAPKFPRMPTSKVDIPVLPVAPPPTIPTLKKNVKEVVSHDNEEKADELAVVKEEQSSAKAPVKDNVPPKMPDLKEPSMPIPPPPAGNVPKAPVINAPPPPSVGATPPIAAPAMPPPPRKLFVGIIYMFSSIDCLCSSNAADSC